LEVRRDRATATPRKIPGGGKKESYDDMVRSVPLTPPRRWISGRGCAARPEGHVKNLKDEQGWGGPALKLVLWGDFET